VCRDGRFPGYLGAAGRLEFAPRLNVVGKPQLPENFVPRFLLLLQSVPSQPVSPGQGTAFRRGFAFVVDCSQAKEFALAHWLVGGADGGRLFVRCFDTAMNVRENIAGDVLASLTTMQWNVPSKAWTGGAVMVDTSLNRRMTVRLGPNDRKSHLMPTFTVARSAFSLAGTALVFSLTSCKQAAKSSAPPAEVSVMSVQPRTVDALVTVPGRTLAYDLAEIRPQVTGVLLKRMFEEGTNVTQGQQLYQIDPSLYQAAYDKAEGTLQHDQAALVYARAHAARWNTLTRDSWTSQEQNDQAISAAGQAAASVKVDQAELASAAINLNYTKMLSPISRRISRSMVTEGALMTANQSTAVATVTQLDPIYVDMTQSSAQLLPLRRQLQDKNLDGNSGLSIPVDLTLEDGRPYGLQGKLSFSEVNVNEGTGTTTLRAIFPNPQHLLLPGMYVRATVHEGTHNDAYFVPQNAVQRNVHADPYVYMVNQKDEVEQRLIQIDNSQGNDWVVTKGLNPGDRIITDGLQRATPGAHVHPTEVALQAAN
jgi:membrane fusion protein (multidrug efflux system)